MVVKIGLWTLVTTQVFVLAHIFGPDVGDLLGLVGGGMAIALGFGAGQAFWERLTYHGRHSDRRPLEYRISESLQA